MVLIYMTWRNFHHPNMLQFEVLLAAGPGVLLLILLLISVRVERGYILHKSAHTNAVLKTWLLHVLMSSYRAAIVVLISITLISCFCLKSLLYKNEGKNHIHIWPFLIYLSQILTCMVLKSLIPR